MLARGDRQHDIAASFEVNGGRIAEIGTGRKFRSVLPADRANLPPRGAYPTGREAAIALNALVAAKMRSPVRMLWFCSTFADELGRRGTFAASPSPFPT